MRTPNPRESPPARNKPLCASLRSTFRRLLALNICRTKLVAALISDSLRRIMPCPSMAAIFAQTSAHLICVRKILDPVLLRQSLARAPAYPPACTPPQSCSSSKPRQFFDASRRPGPATPAEQQQLPVRDVPSQSLLRGRKSRKLVLFTCLAAFRDEHRIFMSNHPRLDLFASPPINNGYYRLTSLGFWGFPVRIRLPGLVGP